IRKALNHAPETSHGMPDGITTIPHSTWKGNDEYVYGNTSPLTNLDDGSNSSVPDANESAEEAKSNDSSDKPSPEAILNDEKAADPAPATSKSPAVDKTNKSKPENVEDLINNIQD